MNRLIAFSIAVLSTFQVCAQDVKPTSVYTALDGKNCRSVKSIAETGASVLRCAGVGNYSLLVLDDDSRMSLTIVSPDQKEHPLDLWTVITKSFSTLGVQAEWRVVQTNGKSTPVALIVRVNANIQDDPDKPQRKSYLAVVKITADQACVTDRVDPSPDANVKARVLADDSARKACLTP